MSNKKAQNATGNSYEFRIIPIESIIESDNIRETKEISSLVASIRAHGLINPITVSIDDEKAKTYKVIAGHGRFAALKILEWKNIPCNVITNAASLDEISLSENVTRMDMTPYEECKAVQHLISKKNTVSHVAKKFGRSVRWVLVRKKLADAGEKVMQKVMDGSIQLSAASKIADLPDEVFKQEMEKCYKTDSYFINGVIERNHKDLAKVPFDTAACMSCDKCSSTQGDLFENEPKSYCLDPVCFQLKMHDEATAKVDELKANGVNARIGEFDSIGKSISYEDDAYSHEIRNEQKKQQAESEGVKKRALVNPENAKVYEYYDYRDLSDYHEETDDEREAREKERDEELKREGARRRILVPRLQEQILEKVKYFGSDGLLAIMLFAGTYDVPTEKVLKANGFEESECDGDIDLSKIPDNFTVSKIVKMIKDSTESIVNSFQNIEYLKKLWNIFARDENIEGRKSLEELEPTEDEILAEIAMKQAAEENDENDDEE